MKKLTKFFFNLIIILIFAVCVFFAGWIQFYVKPGNCAIMQSKTSGIYEKPIIPGQFCWRWERLLPTNVKLETFSLSPYKSRQKVEGVLESADFYKSFLDAENKIDFSYKIDFSITMGITPEKVLNLVKTAQVSNNEELTEYLESIAKKATQKVTDYILSKEFLLAHNIPETVKIIDESEILKVILNDTNYFNGISISQIELNSVSLPDIELYETAKNNWLKFSDELNSKLEKKANEQSSKIFEEDRKILKLKEFTKLLKESPELNDLCKNGDFSTILNAFISGN